VGAIALSMWMAGGALILYGLFLFGVVVLATIVFFLSEINW